MQLKKIDRCTAFVEAAAAAIMLILYLSWLGKHRSDSVMGKISAAAAAILYLAALILFLRVWINDWRKDSSNAAVCGSDAVFSLRETLIIFLILIGWCAAEIAFIYLLRVCITADTIWKDSLDFWTWTDSQHYLDIAEDWYLSEGPYDRLVQLVFLPGYPLTIRAVECWTGNYLKAGMIVSCLSFSCGGTMLYWLAAEEKGKRFARRAIRYAVVLPGSFFFVAPLSDSLFFLLSVGCIYCLKRHNWLSASVLGGMASFTRSLGLLLVVPAGYELLSAVINGKVRKRTSWIYFIALLLIPCGFGGYCMICRAVSGNPFQWMIYQKENWVQEAGLFFNTACYQTENLISSWQNEEMDLAIGLWLPNLLYQACSLVIMIASIRNLRPMYSAYFLAYYAVAIGATWLLSGPRYLLTLFPIVFGAADISEKRSVDIALTGGFIWANALYTVLFAMRWQVW